MRARGGQRRAVEARRRADRRRGAAPAGLVISFHVTVANYEYLVYWRFYQDGNIECEVRATGILVTSHAGAGRGEHGTLVDQGTYAPFHQHFIVARLDLDVDGADNTVYAVESAAVPAGGDDPSRLGPAGSRAPWRAG